MLNNTNITGGELAGEQVDVDGMAERIAELKGERGVTAVEYGQVRRPVLTTAARRVRSPVVPGVEDLQPRRVGGRSERLVRPSWGGKIDPLATRLVGEADERFRCGQ